MPRLTKFTPKLTEDMKTFLIKNIACGQTAPQSAAKLKEQFGVIISTQRVNALKNSTKYYNLFLKIKKAYVDKLADMSDIAVYAKRERIKDADKLRNKVFKIVETIDKRLKFDEEDVKKQNYNLQLVKEFRGLVETHLKTLRYVHDEVEEIKDAKASKNKPTLLQFVNKQNVTVGGKSDKETEAETESIVDAEEVLQGSDTEDI